MPYLAVQFLVVKKRGFEAFMEKVTAVLLVIFFVLAIVLAYMSSK